ncbi:di-trans,poly-cis-decaprenylcistransferase [Antarcticirhabdus aurantiaca]|uniref:Di-trans,poly-cis-decaprenylcistransferase n=1 Tax=Antarcticirhabdus aurantiaca TaxID=2606717 RepID=A0ACD4NU68_9HYPH|nr:di-trans,poly-cis-decaprenylcistransferase [Antarcticirhabdus aurantiaca]WAJ30283.1 di-trans,poly-cis-decaprenylcistransferase [Jeongeuplla avenae]
MQSTMLNKIHLGIIMDGNGRWAERCGLSRSRGHEAGVRAIRPIVEAAIRGGVGTLTLYAFSSDNWRRPAAEVAVLMGLLRGYLAQEIGAFREAGVRLSLVGRRDRLPAGLVRRIAAAEAATAEGRALHLRIAFDYSACEAILAAARLADASTDRDAFSRLVAGDEAPDLDLLLRTGGEKRLSDFLLWESAYAELIFTDRLWPDFGAGDLAAALDEFQGRSRRFGGLPPAAEAA